MDVNIRNKLTAQVWKSAATKKYDRLDSKG